MNIYDYTANNPIIRRDPSGLWSTAAHDYFVEQGYPGLSPADIRAIKAGSAAADSIANQDGSHAYIHSMTSNTLSRAQSETLMLAFIQQHMSEFKKWYCRSKKEKNAYWAVGQRSFAFRKLGMALHPIMDSTSPVHRGFQKWHSSDLFIHGPFPTSLEDVNTAPQYRDETVNLMRSYFSPGSVDCGCEN